MGCIVGSNNFSFFMGSINVSEFNIVMKVGSVWQFLSFFCELGINVLMCVVVVFVSGDNFDNMVMVFMVEQNVVIGVGVQLNLNGKVLLLNIDISFYILSCVMVINSGVDVSYSYFINFDSFGGVVVMQMFVLFINYYRMGSVVIVGIVNVIGVIIFIYN